MTVKRRGMALILVLLASVVLAMLSTAMVSLNRNGLLSLAQYEQRARSMQACYAGLDYARARLVQDGSWSLTDFDSVDATTLPNTPQVRVQETGATPDLNLVVGTLPSEESRFQVRVVNNLSNRFSHTAPAWSRCQISVPARTAFVAVDGWCRGSQRHIEVLLARNTGVGVGIYAGKDLAISLDSDHQNKVLTFSSNLPRGNRVSVNNDVLLPHITNIDFGSTETKGRLQSGRDTKVDSSFSFSPAGDAGTSGGSNLRGDQTLTNQASLEMKANVLTGTPPSPPKFRPDQLKQASPPALLPAGTYRFVNHETVAYSADGNGPWVNHPRSIPLADGRQIRLGEYRFMPEGNVMVDGDLVLVGQQTKMRRENNLMVEVGTTPMPVSLAVGYGSKGLPLSYTAAGDEQSTKARFTVAGNLTIHGDMVGSGQLFVQKNQLGGGSLTVEGNSQLSATRTDGMALVAEDAVHFKDVNALAALQPFAMMTGDFGLYSRALQPNPNTYSSPQQSTIQNWQGQSASNISQVVGADDNPGQTLRGQVISNYASVVQGMAPSFVTAADNDLNEIDVVVPMGTPGNIIPTALTAKDLITRYVDECNSYRGGMTLGRHTRVREFIKSVDRGAPNPALLSIWNPGTPVAGLDLSSVGDVTYDDFNDSILTLVANQVSAYNQDARLQGKALLAYMNTPNSYSNSQRFDFIFGGILYAKKNIYAHLAGRFNLLGSMVSAEGTVGFDHLVGGRVVYDPNSFEEQFDVTKMGLSPNFFWMAP